MANRIRLYPWELASMPEYSTSVPTGTTLWKMWKRDRHALVRGAEPLWVVAQYVPHADPDKVGIKWFEVQLLEGPRPAVYDPPDWSNTARYRREAAAQRSA